MQIWSNELPVTRNQHCELWDFVSKYRDSVLAVRGRMTTHKLLTKKHCVITTSSPLTSNPFSIPQHQNHSPQTPYQTSLELSFKRGPKSNPGCFLRIDSSPLSQKPCYIIKLKNPIPFLFFAGPKCPTCIVIAMLAFPSIEEVSYIPRKREYKRHLSISERENL